MVPEHTEAAAAEAVPPTEVGLTVFKPEKLEVTVPQVPVTSQ